jgi:hypothetical protein
LLIEKGVDFNKLDFRGRSALHYAFVKFGNWQDFTQIDPIETVSSLCGVRGLKTNIPDKWGKIPMHYAA